MFGIELNEDDRQAIERSLASLTAQAGDCGDEYREAPLLTAAGDLGDHIESDTPVTGTPKTR